MKIEKGYKMREIRPEYKKREKMMKKETWKIRRIKQEIV